MWKVTVREAGDDGDVLTSIDLQMEADADQLEGIVNRILDETELFEDFHVSVSRTAPKATDTATFLMDVLTKVIGKRCEP